MDFLRAVYGVGTVILPYWITFWVGYLIGWEARKK
jgi:hypothetical protein